MANESENDYHPPDIKYIEAVLRCIKEVLAEHGGSDIRVARPREMSTRVPDADEPHIESAYDALLREVPRLLEELARFEHEHRQVVGLLAEMICGDFHLSSERFKLDRDVPGELGEQRRQALMMYASMTRGQDSRDRVRNDLRMRGEFSEG